MKAYFLGSSGKDGFFSCFEQLMPKTEGRYIYIIKGGPGTGKSSFMKKIADEMESKDIDCERIFCSSDPDSLDGVIFPSLRVSIADGTSPHVLDPDYPGASGEIINFGDCWNKTLLRERENRIIEATDKYKECHRRCRRFLNSAFSIYSDGERICHESLDRKRLVRYASRIVARNMGKPSGKVGLEKTRLLDAVTPKGYYFLNETAESLCSEKIVFEDNFGAAASVLIEEIRTYALACGYSVISSPSVSGNKRLRHIIIEELSLGFFTEDRLCPLSINETKRVSLKRFYDASVIKENRAKLMFAKKASNELLNEAVISLKEAKKNHDELEKLYIDAMDFDKTEKIRLEISKRIWESDWWPQKSEK